MASDHVIIGSDLSATDGYSTAEIPTANDRVICTADHKVDITAGHNTLNGFELDLFSVMEGYSGAIGNDSTPVDLNSEQFDYFATNEKAAWFAGDHKQVNVKCKVGVQNPLWFKDFNIDWLNLRDGFVRLSKGTASTLDYVRLSADDGEGANPVLEIGPGITDIDDVGVSVGKMTCDSAVPLYVLGGKPGFTCEVTHRLGTAASVWVMPGCTLYIMPSAALSLTYVRNMGGTIIFPSQGKYFVTLDDIEHESGITRFEHKLVTFTNKPRLHTSKGWQLPPGMRVTPAYV